MFFISNDCYVYIVKCADGNFYTGVTNNLHRRLRQHNGLAWGGAKYTRTRRPVTLVYIEKYQSRSEACKREFAIKEMSHRGKEELIDKETKEQVLSSI